MHMIKSQNYKKYLLITFTTQHWPYMILVKERLAQANCPKGMCFDLENKVVLQSLARSEKNHYNNEAEKLK